MIRDTRIHRSTRSTRLARISAVVVAAGCMAAPLAGARTASAASVHPLTRNAAITDAKTAFGAMQKAVIVTPSDSATSFPTGSALVAQVEKYAPGLRGVIVGSRVGSGGHLGLGASTTKEFTAVARLSDGHRITIKVDHDDLGSVSES